MAKPAKIFGPNKRTGGKSADLKPVKFKTADGFVNFAARLGLNNDNTLSEGYYDFNLMTRNRIQLEAAYRGSWICGQIIDCRAQDMTKAGIDITTGKGDKDIKNIQSQFSKLGIWTSLTSHQKWSLLYGGCIAVLQIDGQDLASPLDVSTIGRGQFKGLSVFDRWQLQPDLVQLITTGPDMGLPKYYQIVTAAANGQPIGTQTKLSNEGAPTGVINVHHSRVIRGIGIELPYFQAITEMMWGESVLERLWDRMITFDTATMSAANLIERACNRTVKINELREIIAAGGPAYEGLLSMMEMMRAAQTNEGLTLLDKNDEFDTSQYTFSGLDVLLLSFGQQLAGASETPLVRLFGQSPAGLNATGESDMRMYYDNINAQQETKLRRGVDLLLRVMWRSTYGQAAPDDLEFTFNPLWQMSAKDKADIARTHTETITGAVEAGLVQRSTGMKELRDASGDNGLFSNITNEEIEEAETEEEEGPPLPELGSEKEPESSETEPNPEKQDKQVPNFDSKWGRLFRWGRR